MANIFTPVITGAFDGERIWNMTAYPIAETALFKYIESIQFQHVNKFTLKGTGFESYKHTDQATSGNDLLVNINIVLNNLSLSTLHQLWILAEGMAGAGMELDFRDSLWTNYTYRCRWNNAGDFVENTELLGGATIDLSSWSWAVIS